MEAKDKRFSEVMKRKIGQRNFKRFFFKAKNDLRAL